MQAAHGKGPGRGIELLLGHVHSAIRRAVAEVIAAEGYYALQLGIFIALLKVYDIGGGILACIHLAAVHLYLCFKAKIRGACACHGIGAELRQRCRGRLRRLGCRGIALFIEQTALLLILLFKQPGEEALLLLLLLPNRLLYRRIVADIGRLPAFIYKL